MPQPGEEIPRAPRRGLKFWLRLSYAGVALTCCAILALVIERRIAGALEQAARERLGGQAKVLAQRLEDAVDERLDDMRLLARVLAFEGADMPAARLRELFAELAEAEPHYAWIGFVGADGRVHAATGGLLEGEDVSARPWFGAGQLRPSVLGAHEAMLLAKLLPAEPDGQPLRFIDVTAPVRDADGALLGVVGAHLSLNWADRLQARLQHQAALSRSTEVIIVDAAGLALIAPAGQRGRAFAGQADYEAAASWEVDAADSMRRYLGGSAGMVASTPHTGLDWRVIVRQPADEALRAARALRGSVLVASAVLALLATAAAAWLAARVAAPLRRLAEAAQRMRDGGGGELPVVGGYREAHQLSLVLNRLLHDVKQRESDLQQFADQLEHRVAERTVELEQANAELERLSTTDSLTGLGNRRKFEWHLQKAIPRALRHAQPLALLIFDVDHFKAINDRHGHPAGDRVLRAIAAALQEAMRPSDLLARTGGEEFAVLAADADPAQALAIAERLRLAVAARSPFQVGRVAIPVSISAGCAGFHGRAGSASEVGQMAAELYRRADAALYLAKQNGRDRVESGEWC